MSRLPEQGPTLRKPFGGLLSSSLEPPMRGQVSSPPGHLGEPQEDREPTRSFPAPRASGAKGVPADSASLRLKARDHGLPLSRTKLRSGLSTPACLCPAFSAAHQLCCGGARPPAAAQPLPSPSASLRGLPQHQPSSPAWHPCPLFFKHSPPPPSEGQLLCFPTGIIALPLAQFLRLGRS